MKRYSREIRVLRSYRYLLLFSSAVWLHSMIAATATPTLLNSIRPDDDRSDLSGNSLTVVGASMPRSTNTRFTVSSVRSGGVLKKWTIFDGGCILFLLAIAGFKNLWNCKITQIFLRLFSFPQITMLLYFMIFFRHSNVFLFLFSAVDSREKDFIYFHILHVLFVI